EKNGVGASLDIHAFGLHTLYAETFFQDTSFLSNSVFSRPKITDPDVLRPGRLNRDDGGVSNTGKLNNYAFAIEGGKIPVLEGFNYTLGYARQKGSDVGGELNETSFVAGMWWELPITNRMTLIPLVEYVRQLHRQGTDQNVSYITFGAALEMPKGWTLNAFG